MAPGVEHPGRLFADLPPPSPPDGSHALYTKGGDDDMIVAAAQEEGRLAVKIVDHVGDPLAQLQQSTEFSLAAARWGAVDFGLQGVRVFPETPDAAKVVAPKLPHRPFGRTVSTQEGANPWIQGHDAPLVFGSPFMLLDGDRHAKPKMLPLILVQGTGPLQAPSVVQLQALESVRHGIEEGVDVLNVRISRPLLLRFPFVGLLKCSLLEEKNVFWEGEITPKK
ncbi:hypothetical protein QOT17_009576 [Balamuthia mandrillaris]